MKQSEYSTLATSRTPALIIYLLDMSDSMHKKMGNKRRIDVVMDSLSAVVKQMVFRATKGRKISPRYRIAIYAYNNKVYDVLGGVKSIDVVAQKGLPTLTPSRTTETAKAFQKAMDLLKREILLMDKCPAPLICHMTDGEYTGADPSPIVSDIMRMKVPDGNVLVENIFISDKVLPTPIEDIHKWTGIDANTPLGSSYAKKLREISSAIPYTYSQIMREWGYNLAPNAKMLFPGTRSEMVALGFQMSAATGTGPVKK